MKDTVIETPLIGSGSQEEADLRVQALLTMGTSRGYLTYEELNERLPDEVVSPDKLDSLLMMIDEMGIKLIDEGDIGEYIKSPKTRKKAAEPQAAPEVVED
ncbi:MAG: sigA, partial [Phycisphaerales bacterium]|nr:sigA [Phycisphaerales bacterium]